MSDARRCGPHVELATTPATKITRCTCGTVHLTMNATGVTVRLSTEAFRALAGGLIAAVDRLDDLGEPETPTIN